jgi:hypothetical protein
MNNEATPSSGMLATVDSKSTQGVNDALMQIIRGKLQGIAGDIGNGFELTGDTSWIRTAYGFIGAFQQCGMKAEAAVAALAQYAVLRKRWRSEQHSPEDIFAGMPKESRGKILEGQTKGFIWGREISPLALAAQRCIEVADAIMVSPQGAVMNDTSTIAGIEAEIRAYELVPQLLEIGQAYRIRPQNFAERDVEITLESLRSRRSEMQPESALELVQG